MAVSITNIISKVASGYTKAKASFDYSKAGSASLLDFIEKLGKYGTIVDSKYEVTFSGIDDFTFFITDLNIPSIRRNTTQLHYFGQMVEVPQTIEYEHDFNMTVINDGNGIMYSTLANWLLTVGGDSILDSGYTMTVRLFGDGQNDDGLQIILDGVRFKNIGGLRMSSSSSNISTFDIGCSAIKFTITAGGMMSKIGGFAGAAKDALNLAGVDTADWIFPIGGV